MALEDLEWAEGQTPLEIWRALLGPFLSSLWSRCIEQWLSVADHCSQVFYLQGCCDNGTTKQIVLSAPAALDELGMTW